MSRSAAERELSEQELGDVCGGWRIGLYTRINTRINTDNRNFGLQDVSVNGGGNSILGSGDRNIVITGDGNTVAGRDINFQQTVSG